MSEPSSVAVRDGHSLETISFREYRPADLQRCVEITADAWPEFDRSMQLATVEWYLGSVTRKEVACISGIAVGVLFGKIDSDLTAFDRLKISLSHVKVYLKMFFGLYGRLPHRIAVIRNCLSTDRKIAANSPDIDVEVKFFAVDAAYRGKGIGQALMGRFIDHAKNKGAKKIFVYTTAPGSDWTFYERYGFRKHSSFRDDYMSFARKEEVAAIFYVLDIE